MPLNRRVALLFPGQGAQQPRMAAGLYGSDEVFTAGMDEAFACLGRQGPAVRAAWLADTPSPLFDDVTVAQPLLYAVGCAMGRTVLALGVEPAALLGHSVGELVAATLADVLDFADGMGLMRDRVVQYADTPPGGMLAVAASVAQLAPFLPDSGPWVAAVNAPQQTLVAGTDAQLTVLSRELRAADITCMSARARQAFHSPVVAEAAVRSRPAWHAVRLRAPRIRIYSVHDKAVLTGRRARDPEFWAMQPTTTVHFWPMLDRMLRDEDLLLVEAGPGQGLSALARRHPAVARGRSEVLPLSPPRPSGPEADRTALRRAVERIAAEAGGPLNRPEWSAAAD
jgi:[acyl-carrier-protein] S-malonyltransferase